jgi:aldose 1-epimerase
MEYVLDNGRGIRAHFVPIGASLRALYLPDRQGNPGDVVLGFNGPDEYAGNPAYFGCIVGRCANRIDGGRFVMDGETYQLSCNVDGNQHLHGGVRGFSHRTWRVTEQSTTALTFTYDSADGEEGYPGRVHASVRYALDGVALVIDEHATAERPTIINLTNHTYFNLADAGASSIRDHVLTLLAETITPLRDDFVPTGERAPVAGTPFDFRVARAIGERLDDVRQGPVGYDINYVVPDWDRTLRVVARVHEPLSGRTLEIATTKPGVQFYTGNFLDGTIAGKLGVRYQQHCGFCLEAQYLPDAPNQPSFPSIRVGARGEYRERTEWRFGV